MSDSAAVDNPARKVTLDERVELKLTLTIAGQSYPVWGTNIKHLELHLAGWGLSGALRFFRLNDKEYGGPFEDKLFAAFVGNDPIAIELHIKAFRPDDEKLNDSIDPLVIKALVNERSVEERPYRETDKPHVIARQYTLTFADPAALLWQQHHPCVLYTEKSLQDVLDAHKGDRITCVYDSQVLAKKQPLVFLGLMPARRLHASFYDWVMWLCDSANLGFTYSYKDHSYRFGDQPAELPAPTVLGRQDVGRMSIDYPAVPRHQPRVLNSYTEDARTVPSDAATALQPLSSDYLVRTQIGGEVDDRSTLETKRGTLRQPELRIDFRRLPMYLFGPGDCIDLTKSTSWQTVNVALPQLAAAGKLRCADMRLTLQATEPEFERQEGGNLARYVGQMRVLLEPEAEAGPRLPAYVTPRYPHVVEGKIVSEQGADDEETYDIKTDDQTKLRSYKVKLPLFADQLVCAPFIPTTFSGHFYFPMYKNERVLVALDLFKATITGMLDWRAGAEVPLESQGNQLYLGKKLASSVIMTMVYGDSKPCFKLQRVNDKDVQNLKFEEGILTVFVGEGTDESTAAKVKTIRIKLDKQAGATITVENPDAKITQTVQMDGTTLLLKVQGESDTSTYTQVADTITMEAKNINVKAETLKMSSSKTSTWSSQDTLAISSDKDMSLTSSAALNQKATQDATLKGQNVTITADNAAKLKGTDTTLSGTSSAKLTAVNTTVEGTASTAVKGATVEVNASATLTCKSSAMTTLKGSLVSVEGSLIKMG